MPVKTFTEKPNEELAKVFIETESFSGIRHVYLESSRNQSRIGASSPEVATLFAKGAGIYNTPARKIHKQSL